MRGHPYYTVESVMSAGTAEWAQLPCAPAGFYSGGGAVVERVLGRSDADLYLVCGRSVTRELAAHPDLKDPLQRLGLLLPPPLPAAAAARDRLALYESCALRALLAPREALRRRVCAARDGARPAIGVHLRSALRHSRRHAAYRENRWEREGGD